TKWEAAAKAHGAGKAAGETAFNECLALHEAVVECWERMHEAVSSQVLSQMIVAVEPVMERYRDYKRSAALLDFEDLIHSARDLLAHHPAIRDALATRHTHLLIDEFQDTDPLQAEIFWRLAST